MPNIRTVMAMRSALILEWQREISDRVYEYHEVKMRGIATDDKRAEFSVVSVDQLGVMMVRHGDQIHGARLILDKELGVHVEYEDGRSLFFDVSPRVRAD